MMRCFFFFQAEDGIRDLVRSRGLGDVYKRQSPDSPIARQTLREAHIRDRTGALVLALRRADGTLSLIHI